MKTILTATALIIAATTASAADLIRSNVPSASGSVPGFYLTGTGFFVEEASADRAAVSAIVVPASVDVKDVDEVTAWLEAQGYMGIRPIIETRETLRVEVTPGVFQTITESIPAYAQRW